IVSGYSDSIVDGQNVQSADDGRIVVVGYGSLRATLSGHNVRGTGRRAAGRDKTDIVLGYFDSCVSGQNVQSVDGARTVIVAYAILFIGVRWLDPPPLLAGSLISVSPRTRAKTQGSAAA